MRPSPISFGFSWNVEASEFPNGGSSTKGSSSETADIAV